MNVAALQKHFLDVATFAEAAGAGKKAINDLFACAQALTPFADRPVSDLAAYLARVREFAHSDGPVPMPPGHKGRGVNPKPAGVASARGAPIIDLLYRLYESISTSTLGEEEISKELNSVEKLTKPDLEVLGEKLSVLSEVRKAKSVAEKKSVIRKAISERRSRSDRNHI